MYHLLCNVFCAVIWILDEVFLFCFTPIDISFAENDTQRITSYTCWRFIIYFVLFFEHHWVDWLLIGRKWHPWSNKLYMLEIYFVLFFLSTIESIDSLLAENDTQKVVHAGGEKSCPLPGAVWARCGRLLHSTHSLPWFVCLHLHQSHHGHYAPLIQLCHRLSWPADRIGRCY